VRNIVSGEASPLSSRIGRTHEARRRCLVMMRSPVRR
jgi:hypothetical protein